MHRYSTAHGTTVHPCPCGVFHGHNSHCSSAADDYSSYSNFSPSSSVDCTLSLGTPSTRRTSFSGADNRRSGGSRLSSFCWDFLQKSTSDNRGHRPPTAGVGAGAGDPRRCANCDTTSTPLWRNGPRGPKSLCNACGIRYKKEERRATATAATNGAMESHVAGYGYGTSWGAHQGQKGQFLSPAGNEFRFMDDVVSESSGRDDLQFLSWRLNVTDRPTSQLVYDFTR